MGRLLDSLRVLIPTATRNLVVDLNVFQKAQLDGARLRSQILSRLRYVRPPYKTMAPSIDLMVNDLKRLDLYRSTWKILLQVSFG